MFDLMREKTYVESEPGAGQDADGTQPYFFAAGYAEITEEQRTEERELRRLQSMYPDAAKLMLPYVEEECDRMEYEGSPMFDEYPDRTTIYRIEERVYERVKDRFPEEEDSRKPEALFSMQCRGPGAGIPGRGWVRDLARVLLLQEMHHRRRRHSAVRAVSAQQYLPFRADSGIV